MSSLATDTEYVRGRLAQYGNDLLSLGVDGFRLDAAKRASKIFIVKNYFRAHEFRIDIAATDIANILGRLNSTPYITQEVIWGSGEPIQPSEYVGNGKFYANYFNFNVFDMFNAR